MTPEIKRALETIRDECRKRVQTLSKQNLSARSHTDYMTIS